MDAGFRGGLLQGAVGVGVRGRLGVAVVDGLRVGFREGDGEGGGGEEEEEVWEYGMHFWARGNARLFGGRT